MLHRALQLEGVDYCLEAPVPHSLPLPKWFHAPKPSTSGWDFRVYPGVFGQCVTTEARVLINQSDAVGGCLFTVASTRCAAVVFRVVSVFTAHHFQQLAGIVPETHANILMSPCCARCGRKRCPERARCRNFLNSSLRVEAHKLYPILRPQLAAARALEQVPTKKPVERKERKEQPKPKVKPQSSAPAPSGFSRDSGKPKRATTNVAATSSADPAAWTLGERTAPDRAFTKVLKQGVSATYKTLYKLVSSRQTMQSAATSLKGMHSLPPAKLKSFLVKLGYESLIGLEFRQIKRRITQDSRKVHFQVQALCHVLQLKEERELWSSPNAQSLTDEQVLSWFPPPVEVPQWRKYLRLAREQVVAQLTSKKHSDHCRSLVRRHAAMAGFFGIHAVCDLSLTRGLQLIDELLGQDASAPLAAAPIAVHTTATQPRT